MVKFFKPVITCIAILFCSMYLQKCLGQYILGQIEPPDNYIFQVLLEEDEAIKYIFAECDEVVIRNIKLTSDDKRYLKDKYGIDIKEETFKVYTGLKGDSIARHAIILDCMGCFRPITFILSVNPDGWINDLNVMIYREARGGEVINERFLGQFASKNIETLDSIDTAVTGATASARCLCNGTKKGLLLLQEFYLNKRLVIDKSDKMTNKVNFSSNQKSETIDGHLTAFTQMQLIEDVPAIISIWHSSERKVAKIIADAFSELKIVNNLINNEVKKLNRKGRKKLLKYSEEFTTLLNLCMKYSEKTDGIFDITIHDRDKKTSYKDIMIDGNKIAFTNKKTRIDMSLVKNGYVIDKGIEILKRNGISIAAINYGDSTRVIGKPPREKSWNIGIRYLDKKDMVLGHIKVTDKAVSVLTNPIYHKLNTIRETTSFQLTNRITNVPVNENQWAAVVCAENALESSVFSYVIFMSGLDKNASPFDYSSNIDYALVYDESGGDLKYKASKKMEERFYQKIGSVYDYTKQPVCACEVSP